MACIIFGAGSYYGLTRRPEPGDYIIAADGGWQYCKQEGYYNIYIMEEVQTILSAGAGGSTKLVADGGRRMQRIFNFKYPTEYIQRFAEVLERKKGVADFYDHDLGPETSG